MKGEPNVRAIDFTSCDVYHSAQTPGCTAWASMFPGERGQWYISCEEVTTPETPLPKWSHQGWFERGIPVGYDRSQYRKEIVLLESRDDLRTWQVISRQEWRGDESAGDYGSARTQDGRFLRFVWACYSLDERSKPNEIFYTSDDDGKSWKKEAPFHDEHFVSYAHRLRTLRDGTLVLAVPLEPRWGAGTEFPVRGCTNLNALGGMQMTLWFSYDQGRAWDGPLPIYAGQSVSETDFVELPEGHLLCINNSIFANPGRQIIYRDGRRWAPGSMERATNTRKLSDGPLPEGTKNEDCSWVPETVCLTEDGILVGCMRCSIYQWSDDLGLTWWPLEGAPNLSPEMYQPWIHYLGDGRIVCAGHYGHDDAVKTVDQHILLHEFKLEVLRKTRATKIEIERDFDEKRNLWPNAYTLTLTADGAPLADKEFEFWYVMRYKPGYDSWNSIPLAERMEMGGTLIKLHTDADGKAHMAMPELDRVENPHMSYQFVARFNTDRSNVDYKPAQSPQFSQYCICRQDPPMTEEQ